VERRGRNARSVLGLRCEQQAARCDLECSLCLKGAARMGIARPLWRGRHDAPCLSRPTNDGKLVP
jgi:hypothetical protein